ncbi:Uncharacterised protein [Mycobacteroides abscessus subsp. massiliense]|nr:Uncharacterised protein [Mycobacteroides abscessus subsp. massiliense]
MGCVDLSRGGIGHHGGIQWQLVECDQGQQDLDGARGCMRRVGIAGGEDLAGVQIGHQPCLRRALGWWCRGIRASDTGNRKGQEQGAEHCERAVTTG